VIYRRDIRIEFNHCDPAGIVFYPRYFEMTNSVAENFFREVAGHSYAGMMADFEGVPTARLEADFHAPSRLGEVLEWHLQVDRLGASSIGLTLTAHAEGAVRVTVRLVLVFVSAATGRPVPKPWPAPIRERIATFMEAEDA
jgi:4-hydroxybenzoyl-CoA thioesterase